MIKIFVISVGQKKLQVSQVRVAKIPRLVDFGEIGWKEETLTDIAQKLKHDLGMSRVRVLLSDSLAFVISLEVPQDTADLRDAVAQALQKKKPEVVAGNDWDFRISGEREGYFKALVFAPEKRVWGLLKRAFAAAKITIEAVEPELLAKERDGVAEIGLALKTDLGGWDQQTLNVVPEASEAVSGEGDLPKKKEKKQGTGFRWVWALLAILTLLGVVIGGVVVSKRALESRTGLPEPKAFPSLIPVATESGGLEDLEASPSAVPETKLDLSHYSIQVLNGSGVGGAASKAGLLLEEEGFEDIDLGNADASTYELTLVSRKEEVEDNVVAVVVGALEETYEVEEADDVLPQESAYDLVVTVGRAK